MIKNTSKNIRFGRGYTLLFAVLVSALVLAVGVSILNISRKELILTAGARNSEYAFYAADTGYECALYYDYQGPLGNGTTLFASSTFTTGSTVNCGTSNASGTPVSSTVSASSLSGPGPFDYTFSVPVAGAACAYVDVNKVYNPLTGHATTTVSSMGYNIGWENGSPNGDCNGAGTNSEKVSRELVTSYQD